MTRSSDEQSHAPCAPPVQASRYFHVLGSREWLLMACDRRPPPPAEAKIGRAAGPAAPACWGRERLRERL
jgi:hypothetical protein